MTEDERVGGAAGTLPHHLDHEVRMARLRTVYVVTAIRIVTDAAVYDIDRAARAMRDEIGCHARWPDQRSS